MEKNDLSNVIRTTLIISWCLTILCLIIKLIGFEIFNIICTNERFIKICEFVQNSILYYIVGYISNLITTILLWLSMARKKSFKNNKTKLYILIITIMYVFQAILQTYFNPLIISIIFSIVKYILIPIFVLKIDCKMVIIISTLDFVFQFISIITKNVDSTNTIYSNVLVCLIFMIDYYSMLVLTYIYSYTTNKKEE